MNRHGYRACVTLWLMTALAAGCVTPQYAVRPVPSPVESPDVVALEQRISAEQAQALVRNHPLVDGSYAASRGLDIPSVLGRVVSVSERPNLRYHVFIIQDPDPNAAALADGRFFITTGMLDYLRGRGARPDELAIILGHELGHTTAQHLVKRLQQIQWTSTITNLAGAAISGMATRGSSAGSVVAQQAGQWGSLVSQVVGNVYISGYSQGQELEADQLGARYAIKAGFDPRAGIALLQDFERFDVHGLYLSTHPYSARRAADLERFLHDIGWQPSGGPSPYAAPSPMRLMAPPPAARVRVPASVAPRALHLQQIVWNREMPSARRAVIDGRTVKMGDILDGAQVILIEQRRVQLFKDGRTFWVMQE